MTTSLLLLLRLSGLVFVATLVMTGLMWLGMWFQEGGDEGIHD